MVGPSELQVFLTLSRELSSILGEFVNFGRVPKAQLLNELHLQLLLVLMSGKKASKGRSKIKASTGKKPATAIDRQRSTNAKTRFLAVYFLSTKAEKLCDGIL